MNTQKVNFNCLTSTVEIIDKMAADDHRDRTSMLNKMIDFYLKNNGHAVHALHPKNGTTTKKKAGAR